MKKKSFTHLNKKNSPTVVDISKKKNTKRFATAQGIIKFNKSAFNQINKFKTKKGEIINIAILSGIIGSKKTSELIPLCHNIPIENTKIDIISIPKQNSLKIICDVKTDAKTGVEMEALVGASIACLTIYDMCKSIYKSIIIKEIKLMKKKRWEKWGVFKIKIKF